MRDERGKEPSSDKGGTLGSDIMNKDELYEERASNSWSNRHCRRPY